MRYGGVGSAEPAVYPLENLGTLETPRGAQPTTGDLALLGPIIDRSLGDPQVFGHFFNREDIALHHTAFSVGWCIIGAPLSAPCLMQNIVTGCEICNALLNYPEEMGSAGRFSPPPRPADARWIARSKVDGVEDGPLLAHALKRRPDRAVPFFIKASQGHGLSLRHECSSEESEGWWR